MFRNAFNRIERKQDTNILLTIGLYLIILIGAIAYLSKYFTTIYNFIEKNLRKVTGVVNGKFKKFNIFNKQKRCKCHSSDEGVCYCHDDNSGDSIFEWDDSEATEICDEEADSSNEDEE